MANVVTFKLEVDMEDGGHYEVTADQRDCAKWEVQPFGTSMANYKDRLFTFMRFVAYSALSRQKQLKMTWSQFDEKCVNADITGDVEGDDADPTKSAASAEA
jgi:hypothetical protein